MKILMVCLGNICRSPMAEGILRHIAAEQRIDLEVDSAGTSSWHAGENPDKRAIACAKKHGIHINHLQARHFTAADFEQFDTIYVMDSQNYTDVCHLALNDTDKNKVHLLLNEVEPNANRAVPDPYYGNEDGFEHVYQLLYEACSRICHRLKN